MADYISELVDATELRTMKWVVRMLKEYDIKLVIEALENDIKEQEAIGRLAILIGSTTDGVRDLNVKETPSTAKPKRGRPTEIKRDITKTSQSGLREGLTRATFIIREDTLDRLKQRAYDDRKKLKDIVTEALDYYLYKTKTKHR